MHNAYKSLYSVFSLIDLRMPKSNHKFLLHKNLHSLNSPDYIKKI